MGRSNGRANNPAKSLGPVSPRHVPTVVASPSRSKRGEPQSNRPSRATRCTEPRGLRRGGHTAPSFAIVLPATNVQASFRRLAGPALRGNRQGAAVGSSKETRDCSHEHGEESPPPARPAVVAGLAFRSCSGAHRPPGRNTDQQPWRRSNNNAESSVYYRHPQNRAGS